MLLKQKLAPCSLAPMVKVIITLFPPLTKEERNRGFNLPGRNKDVMIYLGTSFKIRLYFFFWKWLNKFNITETTCIHVFCIVWSAWTENGIECILKTENSSDISTIPIKQQNNQPVLFVSSLTVCKAPFPILEAISWRTSSILRCIQCMCKLDAEVRQTAA